MAGLTNYVKSKKKIPVSGTGLTVGGKTIPPGAQGSARGDTLTPEQRYRRGLRKSLGVTDVRKASGGALSRVIRAGLVGPGTSSARVRRAQRKY